MRRTRVSGVSKHLDPSRLDDRRIRDRMGSRIVVDVSARMRELRHADTQKMLAPYLTSAVG